VKRITTIRFELGPGAAWHIAIAIMRARGLPLQGLDAPAALPAPVVLDGAGI
jgi:hypothetical protein